MFTTNALKIASGLKEQVLIGLKTEQCTYKNKTKYNQLKEYGELVGINIEEYGYFFTYKMPKKKYQDALALIESKLDVNDALILGNMKKIEYKIGYMKQK